jgi:glycosyltransferase involved in cell wall biosynthesis
MGMAGAKLASRMGLASVGCYHVDLEKYSKLYGRTMLGAMGQWFGFKMGRVCDKRAYGRCSALCVPSETAAEIPRSFFSGEISVIPNPVDVSRFCPSPTREGAFRAQYNADGKALVVVVGRIAQEKNLDLVCEHLSRDPRINTVFVGDGPYSGTLKSRWNATVTDFLHGDDLVAAYQQADVFVQLSVTETFGLCLAEAMASGLPAIAMRAQGLMDRIPPGNGVDMIEEAQLAELADRCVALTADKERHRDYAHRARSFIEQLSADAVLPRFMEFHRNFAR